jgi:hypothetical protein
LTIPYSFDVRSRLTVCVSGGRGASVDNDSKPENCPGVEFHFERR